MPAPHGLHSTALICESGVNDRIVDIVRQGVIPFTENSCVPWKYVFVFFWRLPQSLLVFDMGDGYYQSFAEEVKASSPEGVFLLCCHCPYLWIIVALSFTSLCPLTAASETLVLIIPLDEEAASLVRRCERFLCFLSFGMTSEVPVTGPAALLHGQRQGRQAAQ